MTTRLTPDNWRTAIRRHKQAWIGQDPQITAPGLAEQLAEVAIQHMLDTAELRLLRIGIRGNAHAIEREAARLAESRIACSTEMASPCRELQVPEAYGELDRKRSGRLRRWRNRHQAK
jgi:hypothetical protein